ncbi:MAG TPA: PRC-barrel domain-containing protein [Planctomycetota bacterium]|nr:PRC-barrel domain-containing protein [Planctomycetota bacterium]
MKFVRWLPAATALVVGGSLFAQAPVTDDRTVAGADGKTTALRTERCKATRLIGTDIKNTQGENLGEIEDIVLDAGGRRIAYVVVGYGGFLGMGEKLFAMPWGLIQLTPRGKDEDPVATLALDKDTLKKSPGFDKDRWPDFADRTWSNQVDEFYRGKYTPPAFDDRRHDPHGGRDTNPGGNQPADRNDPARRDDARDGTGGAGSTGEMGGTNLGANHPRGAEFVHRRLSKLIGVNVVDANRKSLGEIEDFIVDLHRGAVDAAVIGYGGVLGMGEKFALVPFDMMSLDRDRDVYVLPATKDRVEAVAFSGDRMPALNDDAWLVQGRDYFGKAKSEFRTDRSADTGETPVTFRDFYDPKTTETVTGVITTIGTVRVGDEREERVRLRVRADDGREVIVYGAPYAYSEQNALGLRAGKKVEVTGSRAKYGSQTVLVAGSIKSVEPPRELKLRDAEGKPVWDCPPGTEKHKDKDVNRDAPRDPNRGDMR